MLDFGFKVHGFGLQKLSEELVPLKIGRYKFPMECLVDVQGKKRVIKTVVPGLDGTIKEFSGFDDYSISVHVILQARNYDLVLEELEKVIEQWESIESIPIVCPKTEAYGISMIVFESFSHPETEGLEGTERLTLNFVSDREYEFEVEL